MTQGSDERLTTALLTMDVVDELRHRDDELKLLAEKGLDDAGLKRRLAEIYRSQGIDVPDAVLDAGIAAQRERRYVYTAPRGLSAWLARGWIARRVVATRTAIVVSAVLLLASAVHFGYTIPKESRAQREVAELNASVAGIADRVAVARTRHEQARAALTEVLDKAAAIPHADRLQALRTDVAGAARAAERVAQQKLGELAAAPSPPRVERIDGKNLAAVPSGDSLVGEAATELVRAQLAIVDWRLKDVSEATTHLEKAAGTVQSAIEVSALLDSANAAAIAAKLPEDAELVRVREFAAGDAALRGANVSSARDAAGKIDRLGRDVAELTHLRARIAALRAEALATGVAGQDLATVEADFLDAHGATRLETITAARASVPKLEALVQQLAGEFRYRIVNRRGEKSGVWRYSNDSPGVRNHYLVIEAVNGAGEAVALPIRNEETGDTEVVTTFAVRVPEAEYERVGRDKQDNGLIEVDVVGKKARGALQPTFDIPTAGGFITAW